VHSRGDPVRPGEFSYVWSGTDNSGSIVPSESYAVRIRLASSAGDDIYDPLNGFHPVYESPEKFSYSRQTGTLSYQLSRNSRVHYQVGVSWTDPKTKRVDAAVMRTIVDREPRGAGSVVEAWNGFDKSGTIYIPDLQNFFISILAESLPENSIIVSGSSASFRDYALTHRPKETLKPTKSEGDHMHHAGLTALGDHSPEISLTPVDAVWNGKARRWELKGQLKLEVSLDATSTPFFLAQPTEVQTYVDGRLVKHSPEKKSPCEVIVPSQEIGAGEHLVTVDWVSKYGPVGAQTIRTWSVETASNKSEGSK